MEILDVVVHAICEKKAQDVRVYDVTSLTPFMDSMIVCSTTNIRQNNAIAQNIKEHMILMPIPQSEIDLNPNLVQNAGY